jgi:hypothetical protein
MERQDRKMSGIVNRMLVLKAGYKPPVFINPMFSVPLGTIAL